MKKIILRATTTLAFCMLLSCSCCIAGQAKKDRQQARLFDFIEYCNRNEGLQHTDPSKDYSKASLHELKKAATFFLEQKCFDDVTSYDEIEDVCRIVDNK